MISKSALSVISPAGGFFWSFKQMISTGILKPIRKEALISLGHQKQARYGIVAVFKDLYGNLWELVQFH